MHEEPKYCEECGRKLLYITDVYSTHHDMQTGDLQTIFKFTWICPGKRFLNGHTRKVRFGKSKNDALMVRHDGLWSVDSF
jgi:hypothetical protein